MNLRLYLLLLFFCGIPATLQAQQARIEGLEGNAAYMQLLAQQRQLQQRQDSIGSLIGQIRGQFEEATDKSTLSKQIVALESQLYDLRSASGKITAQVSAIEQDYLLKQLNQPAGVRAEASPDDNRPQYRTLFLNPIFRDNFPDEEITLLQYAPRIERRVQQSSEAIAPLYKQLVELRQQYDGATSQERIDSIAQAGDRLKGQIEALDADIEVMWLTLYRHKIDNYPWLVDKLENVDRLRLEQIDQESRGVRRAEGLNAGSLAPLVSTFPLQKKLALDYELLIAEELGLRAAADSLRACLKQIPPVPDYSDIDFPVRNLIVYAPITVGPRDIPLSEIPTIQIPQTGIYYSVLLTTYVNPPTSSAPLKKMTPLMQQKTAEGRTRYFAGGFRTYAEAIAAQVQMARAGFRAPAVMAWVDGKYTAVNTARALETKQAAAKPKTEGEYTLNILPPEGRLSSALRDLITEKAPSKNIIRRASERGVIYSVGTFSSKAEAEALGRAMQEKENVEINITNP